jgi:hypothetical protein
MNKKYRFFKISDWDETLKPLYFVNGRVSTTDKTGEYKLTLIAKTKKEAIEKFKQYPNNLKGNKMVICMTVEQFYKMRFSAEKF